MRLVPRLAVPVIALAFAAGCGGSQVAYQEVPGDPVELSVPGDASALAPAAPTATPTPTPAADATEDAPAPRRRPAPEAPDDDAPRPLRRATAGGGTEAPAGEEGTRPTRRPDAEASSRTFCTHNPGAC